MEQPVTYHIEYELDEFQPWPGMAIYAYGVATISYKWEGRDRDTGDDAGPYDIELEHLTISADKAKEPDRCIEQTHPLFLAVEAAIQSDDHVIQACIDDYEQN
jgi:hypothetical protein